MKYNEIKVIKIFPTNLTRVYNLTPHPKPLINTLSAADAVRYGLSRIPLPLAHKFPGMTSIFMTQPAQSFLKWGFKIKQKKKKKWK